MNKTVNQITDVSQIEKELDQTASGVLAFFSKDELVVQDAVNFVYKDKNIFIFFDNDDENYEKIKLDTFVSFTIVKSNSLEKNKKIQESSGYYLFSVTINGTIKTVDDNKLISLIQKNYFQKYDQNSDQQPVESKPIVRILYIDSEEIQAFEETGD